MSYHVIANPVAGKKDHTQKLKQQLEGLFQPDGYELYVTQKPGDARETAARLASCGEEMRIYAVGGDGTLNEVAEGASPYANCAVGCLPSGSGNDFVKTFSIDKSLREHVEQLINGHEVLCDLIRINGRTCINSLSVGFDADICHMTRHLKKLPLLGGRLSYYFAVFICLLRRINSELEISVDGGEFVKNKYALAVAANGKYYGGSFCPAPKADPCDGKLDFLVVNKLSRLSILKFIGRYQKGTHTEIKKLCTAYTGTRMVVQASKPFAMQYDGETLLGTRMECELSPYKIRFIIPNTEEMTHEDL